MTPEERAAAIVDQIHGGEREEAIVAAAIRKAVAEEREACARLADAEVGHGDPYCCDPTAERIAANIRERGVVEGPPA